VRIMEDRDANFVSLRAEMRYFPLLARITDPVARPASPAVKRLRGGGF